MKFLFVGLPSKNASSSSLSRSLGSKSIYGDDGDIIVWDSAMTETDKSMIDLFYRQALIGGKRAPVLFGGPFDLLKALYLNADGEYYTI